MTTEEPSGAPHSSYAEDMAVRLDAVERLMKLFRLERVVYLAATSISVAMLLVSAGFVIATRKATNVELVGFFGSSGLITFSAGRLLLMWNQALSLLAAGQKGVRP
jgi:uncharacterized Tic20 family protein